MALRGGAGSYLSGPWTPPSVSTGRRLRAARSVVRRRSRAGDSPVLFKPEMMTEGAVTAEESGEFNRMDGAVRADRSRRCGIHPGARGVATMAGHDHFRVGAAMIPRRPDHPWLGLRTQTQAGTTFTAAGLRSLTKATPIMWTGSFRSRYCSA